MAVTELSPNRDTEKLASGLTLEEEKKVLGEVALFHENPNLAERTLVQADNYHKAWDPIFRAAHEALGTNAPKHDEREWTPLGPEGEYGQLSLVTKKVVSPRGAYKVIDTSVKKPSGQHFRSVRADRSVFTKANKAIRESKSRQLSVA